MALVVVGLNHQTAPLQVRERFSVARVQLCDALNRVARDHDVQECVILSTCNRTEIYTVTQSPDNCQSWLQSMLSDDQGHELEREFTYSLRDQAVVEHLFSVSSGLNSLVLGENQILGQVREAFVTAKEASVAGPVLEKLFHWALKVGKMARSQTKICQGAASVAAAAIELAEDVFGQLKDRRVLLLGAGKMTQSALTLLRAGGVSSIRVVNRTIEKATELANRCGGQAMPFDQLDAALTDSDLLLSSTGAPHYVVTRDRLKGVMRKRRGNPLLIVDIAVPRDIEPSCESIDNVYLYNIDDLQQVVAGNLERRRSEVKLVMEIIQRQSGEFLRDLDARKVGDAIRSLRSNFEDIRKVELERFCGKHHPSLQERKYLEQLSEQLLNKLLHAPTQRLRELGAAGMSVEQLSSTLEMLGMVQPKAAGAFLENGIGVVCNNCQSEATQGRDSQVVSES
jgi:glutamyl-tRNA reductase